MDNTTTPPTPMVLIQWQGISPKEASWEPWEIVYDKFHLEDKVNFPRDGIDSN